MQKLSQSLDRGSDAEKKSSYRQTHEPTEKPTQPSPVLHSRLKTKLQCTVNYSKEIVILKCVISPLFHSWSSLKARVRQLKLCSDSNKTSSSSKTDRCTLNKQQLLYKVILLKLLLDGNYNKAKLQGFRTATTTTTTTTMTRTTTTLLRH